MSREIKLIGSKRGTLFSTLGQSEVWWRDMWNRICTRRRVVAGYAVGVAHEFKVGFHKFKVLSC